MLSDKELLGRLSTLCRASRRIDVSVLILLNQVEDRRLELRSAYPSLYEFCRQELGMSEGTTHRRVESARLVRRIPKLVDHLKTGSVTLSALALLRNHLTETNYEELIARVAGKTRKQIELVIAELSPRPDVVARMEILPARPMSSSAAATTAPADGSGAVNTGDSQLAVAPPSGGVAPSATMPEGKRARLEPLAPARWKLQLTASQELHDKLERLQTLMRHKNPSGDLAVIVEAAVDRLLEDLEKVRRAPTPQASPAASGPATAKTRTTKPGAVSAATRRAVFERDGARCTYADADGRRCEATTFLEIDHIEARAKGGSGELPNLRVRCRAHNRLHAEEDFGRAHVARRIAERTSTLEVKTRSGRQGNGSDASNVEMEAPSNPAVDRTGS